MRSSSSNLGRKFVFFFRNTLVALLLITLVGCSSQDVKMETDQLEIETEIEQLTAENERLHTELDKAMADLEAAELRVKELENELKPVQELQGTPSLSVDITPPELTQSEMMIGQWFLQNFHEEGIFSFTQILVLNSDGTGTMSRRYYIPKSEVEEVKSYPIPLADFDSSVKCTWSLNGNILRIPLEDGDVGELTYSPEEQLLQVQGSNDRYGREMPSVMEQYVERALYSEDLEAMEAARRHRFLGLWYFDVLTWTFNDDGTGVLDIPKLGDQPATKRKFTYRVQDDRGDPTFLCLWLDWDDGNTTFFYPEFNAAGSMSLKDYSGTEAMKLTRTFDIDNCPISEQIISTGIGVVSGSMFSDILGS